MIDTAYSQKSLQQLTSERALINKANKQDELERAYQISPTRAPQLSSFEQMELSRRESFLNQLDQEISLSFQQLGSTRFSYQPQADSFDQLDLDTSLSLTWFSLLRRSSSSFEFRALSCTALLYKTRINIQLQVSQVQTFQLTGFQLSSVLVSGGVQLRASSQQALQRRTLTASTLTSLSLARVKPYWKRAWSRRTFPALTLS